MKAALIVPNAHLDTHGHGDLHLLLAHLMKVKSYVSHYQTERLKGAYLILDNSAHEYREGIGAAELLKFALKVKAQEIVVPDVLDDGPATVARAVEALEDWFEGTPSPDMYELNPVLMYVPQGAGKGEYWECVQELIDLHIYMAKRKHSRRDFVLGVSKDYDDFSGGLMEILDTLEIIKDEMWADKEIRMHCHILGWARHLWCYTDLARKHKWIRSTDSCKPFQYAIHNLELEPGEDPPPYPKRHATGFHKAVLDSDQLQIADRNIQVFRDVAGGRV